MLSSTTIAIAQWQKLYVQSGENLIVVYKGSYGTEPYNHSALATTRLPYGTEPIFSFKSHFFNTLPMRAEPLLGELEDVGFRQHRISLDRDRFKRNLVKTMREQGFLVSTSAYESRLSFGVPITENAICIVHPAGVEPDKVKGKIHSMHTKGVYHRQIKEGLERVDFMPYEKLVERLEPQKTPTFLKKRFFEFTASDAIL